MYIQHCVKGIAGEHPGFVGGISADDALRTINDGIGLISNWWRGIGSITPQQIAEILVEDNLDRHLHDYDVYGGDSPFISLSCGAVERDTLVQHNWIYSAVDTALMFATEDWTRPGALFYLWTPVSHKRAVGLSTVAEPVRDLTIYRRWSPFQLEGEITAKVSIPSNQISHVEWWDGAQSRSTPTNSWQNPAYVDPSVLGNIRELF